MSEVAPKENPEILLSTANFDSSFQWQEFHRDPQFLGRYVSEAGFDGVALHPNGAFQDAHLMKTAVDSGRFVIGSLVQNSYRFDIVRRASASKDTPTNNDRRLWHESLAHFHGLLQAIGSRPVTMNARALREDDQASQEIIGMADTQYLASVHNGLTAAWDVQSVDELITELYARGYGGFSLNMSHAQLSRTEYSSVRGKQELVVPSTVVSDAMRDPESIIEILGATKEIFIPLMGQKVPHVVRGFAYEGRGQDSIEVADLLQGRVPTQIHKLARAAMAYGNLERIRLGLFAYDLSSALYLVNQKTDDNITDVWNGYKAIGATLREAFSHTPEEAES